ncbi:MAG TPA: SpoIID/LytB domain-containing protein, partial [Anaeromyxobacteraceae bacterium]|nr:SpoIID/LytB domain-containing protein [Anaeromyxobacteraceae bacterium]
TAAPSDPLELLWSHRLHFSGGEPLVTIRIMEGQDEIVFRPRGRARVSLRGGGTLALDAGARVRVRAREAWPASLAFAPLLLDADADDRAQLDAGRRRWEERGVRVRSRVTGGVYGIAGRVVDNRRELLLAADGDGSEAAARESAESIRALAGWRPALHAELLAPPAGKLDLTGDGDRLLGTADTVLSVEVEGDAGLVVERVEHEAAPSVRVRADRAYGGRLFVTLDARGRLAAVHGVTLEALLRGLVPSEMPASVHVEALKAQAVTARSNVLAQIGQRHATDPYLLCPEVHCQAYHGEGAHTARTDAAVEATRGEALFRRQDRTLVDAVYSAMCGGHGEDNDMVWGNAPDPSLRGRPDLPPAAVAALERGLRDEERLRPFLARPPAAWCALPRGGRPDRFRWERRLGAAERERFGGALGVGTIASIEVRSRGVSGRARLVRIAGRDGEAEVAGELRIRRALGNLPSSMFVVDREDQDLLLRGGGWGHGAGMCQWGAVGRAAAGQGYREILGAYYGGAEVARIY